MFRVTIFIKAKFEYPKVVRFILYCRKIPFGIIRNIINVYLRFCMILFYVTSRLAKSTTHPSTYVHEKEYKFSHRNLCTPNIHNNEKQYKSYIKNKTLLALFNTIAHFYSDVIQSVSIRKKCQVVYFSIISVDYF